MWQGESGVIESDAWRPMNLIGQNITKKIGKVGSLRHENRRGSVVQPMARVVIQYLGVSR